MSFIKRITCFSFFCSFFLVSVLAKTDTRFSRKRMLYFGWCGVGRSGVGWGASGLAMFRDQTK